LRLILDAHVSGRAVASALRGKGHDVFAIDEHRDLEGLDDDGVLALAADEQRILVTFDVKDFMPLLRQWGSEQRIHAGCVLIPGIAANEFGTLIQSIVEVLDQYPNQAEWVDLSVFKSR
jgi:predicted nuclease of predicted toxin-antitoxin system